MGYIHSAERQACPRSGHKALKDEGSTERSVHEDLWSSEAASVSSFPPNIFILKDFKPTEKLKEEKHSTKVPGDNNSKHCRALFKAIFILHSGEKKKQGR